MGELRELGGLRVLRGLRRLGELRGLRELGGLRELRMVGKVFMDVRMKFFSKNFTCYLKEICLPL